MTVYALLQIAIFAIPAGIMCSAFDEEWAKEHEARTCAAEAASSKTLVSCPHCEKSFEYRATEEKP